MAYDIHQVCSPCNGTGSVFQDGVIAPCKWCNATGKVLFGNTPNLETAVGGLTADVASLGDTCKTILEYCEKILSVVGKG